MRSWLAVGALIAAPVATGCAAEAREARAPEAAAAATAAPAPPPVVAVMPAPELAGAAPAPSTSAFENPSTAGSVSEARLALTRSSRELASAAGNCTTACRALGSMDRATARLCGLAVSPADQRACADAKSKVVSARTEVRAACTSCPAGVVVDPDAPCPSP